MLKWTEKLATGSDAIDSQHREIFLRVHAASDAMSKGQGKDEVAATISFLEDYIKRHFSMEEGLMERLAFPGAQTHKNEHAKFIEHFGELKDEFEKEGPNSALAIKLQGWLTKWCTNHIAKIDAALGAFLKTKSL